jgi:predicted GNAT superfamily acetyltransferase
VQWNIREPHVERRLARDPTFRVRAEDTASAPVVNRDGVNLEVDERRVWVEIPMGFTELQQHTPDAALTWRMQTRQIFQTYFARGYRAVDFELRTADGRGRYLLARP